MIKILYFMGLVDVIGCAQEEIPLPEDVLDVKSLLESLIKRGQQYQKALADVTKLQITINKRFVEPDAPVQNGDEIAFFPTLK
ncbi:MoaD/ThiS family protein [Sulfurirhabdus autotrophica]|uniref:Molybdopterin synthase sulfur carrier subunit n=1 Tax=Sulfurirhabdus autotrophica TaxID=1706046 RepID=A0A4R3YCD7_9PROT|nr:MoaD/ThiS family protein [Sulfurirhabdus autotrophica]TCV88063.1 molybdopterin synthase sulfur carrier subunit [Sulfurirhabdus autotrophica]